jgi:hypothetical protein
MSGDVGRLLGGIMNPASLLAPNKSGSPFQTLANMATPLGGLVTGGRDPLATLGAGAGIGAGLAGGLVAAPALFGGAASAAAPALSAAPQSVEAALAASKAIPAATSGLGNIQNAIGLANLGGNLAGTIGNLGTSQPTAPISLPSSGADLLSLLQALQQQAMQGSVTPSF